MKRWPMLAAMLLATTYGFTCRAASSATTAEPSVFASCGGFLEGGAFDTDGNLWIVDLTGDRVLTVDPSGACHVKAKTGGHPNGARLAPDGRLFITDNDRGLVAFDRKSGSVTTIVGTDNGRPMRSANDLAFDRSGGVYFTVPNKSSALDRTGELFYLPPGTGQQARAIRSNIPYPNGVVVSNDDETVFVGQFADKSIVALPTVGNTNSYRTDFIFARTDGGFGPDGMAIAPDGTMYWAEFGDASIGRADPGGHTLPTIHLGHGSGTYVTNLAIRDGWLYATEAQKGQVWRVRITQ